MFDYANIFLNIFELAVPLVKTYKQAPMSGKTFLPF